jgi:hypothetical protein
MSLADARCSAVQCASLVSAGAVTAASVVSAGAVNAASVVSTGAVVAGSINADVAPARIVNIGPAPGGTASLTSALVPGLTAGSVLFVQQKSSGAAVTPVVASTVAVVGPPAGFAVVLTADAVIPAGADYWVYIADF